MKVFVQKLACFDIINLAHDEIMRTLISISIGWWHNVPYIIQSGVDDFKFESVLQVISHYSVRFLALDF
jgi:hypothetical protein